MSNLSGLNLGAPIGTHTGNTTTAVSEAGEHGAGVGVSGGHSSANAHNSQSGGSGLGSSGTGLSSSGAGYSSSGQNDGFNSGLGGEHASAGIPSGHSSSHPIADKFTSGSHNTSSGLGSSGDAVSGSYAGGQTRDALTGESNAHSTGAGVGPLGENPRGQDSSRSTGTGAGLGAAGGALGGAAAAAGLSGHSHDNSSSHHHQSGAGSALGGSGSGVGSGLSGHSHSHDNTSSNYQNQSQSGSGILPSGAAGGDYNRPAGTNRETALAPDAVGGHHSGSHSGAGLAGVGAGAGAAGLGAGALAGSGHNTHGSNQDSTLGSGNNTSGQGHSSSSHGTSNSPLVGEGGATGKYGTTDHDSSRGQPLADPKELDSGGRHGLVFQESTGTYVHRHELEDAKSSSTRKH